MVKGILYLNLVLFTMLFLSCHKDTTENMHVSSCNFTNFRYYGSAKDTLGEMSNNYLSVMFDTTYSESEIRKFISTSTIFDQNYHYTFYTDIDSITRFTIVKFLNPKSCEEITDIIYNLQKNPIVFNANYTIKTNFCQTAFGMPAGNLCVIAYTTCFM